MDTSLIKANSISFSEDNGRLLKILTFLYFRRKYTDILYFSEKKECDFLIFNKLLLLYVYQVYCQINIQNKKGGIDGLIAAMDCFEIKKYTIGLLPIFELL